MVFAEILEADSIAFLIAIHSVKKIDIYLCKTKKKEIFNSGKTKTTPTFYSFKTTTISLTYIV